jgi:hypothetical protein
MKKIFTLIAVAAMALTAGAQEVGLFDYSTAYEDGQSISTANAKLTLGDDMKGWKVSATKITEGGFLNAFGQTVTVTTDDGDKEQFSAITLAGQNNPKDEAASGKGSGINCAEGKTSAHLPLNGTYYIFQPTASGPVQIGINLNADKAFYLLDATNAEMVHDDSKDKDYLNVALPEANLHNYVIKNADGEEVALEDDGDGKGGKIVAEKTTGVLEFEAEAGKTYYFFCAGSKLGCFGYVFNAAGEPGGLTDPALPVVLDDWGKFFMVNKSGVKKGDKFVFYGEEVAVEGWQWGAQIHPKANAEGWPNLCDVLQLKDGKAIMEITEAMAETINASGGFICQGMGVVVNSLEFVELPNYAVTTVWEGNVTLSWGDGGRVAIPAAPFVGVPAGSILTVCYSQVPNQWDQAAFVYGDWGEDGINFDEGDYQFNKTMVPTDLYGWTFGDRETPLVLTQTILDNIQARKTTYSEESTGLVVEDAGIIIQGSGLTFTKVTISVLADDAVNAVSVQNNHYNGAIYNLAGVRVNKDYKGIVIQNGKKFIQK